MASDLDLCGIEGSALSALSGTTLAEGGASQPLRSRFPGPRSFREASGRMFKRGSPPPPNGAVRARRVDLQDDEVDQMGCTPWLRAKMQRPQPGGCTDCSQNWTHSRGISVLRNNGDVSDVSSSSQLQGIAQGRSAQHPADATAAASPQAGCLQWPQSMVMARGVHVGAQRDGAANSTVPISSGQHKSYCAPSVGALWTYVTRCWVEEDGTEGLHAGAKGAACCAVL